MNIYVSNLSYKTTNNSLQELFAKYGEVTSSSVIVDRETGRSRCFGFIDMPVDVEGKKALSELNEMEFEGNTISVKIARPRLDRK